MEAINFTVATNLEYIKYIIYRSYKKIKPIKKLNLYLKKRNFALFLIKKFFFNATPTILFTTKICLKLQFASIFQRERAL